MVSMKLSPKSQLKGVAAALLVAGVCCLVGCLFIARPLQQLFDLPWQKTFVSETDFRFYRTALRDIFYILLPGLGLIQVWAAWRILSCAKKIPDPPAPAEK